MNRLERIKNREKVAFHRDMLLLPVVHLLFLLANACLAVYLFESLWRLEYVKTIDWMYDFYQVYWCCVAIVVFFEMGIYFISNRVFVSTLVTNLLLFIVGVVNYLKYQCKGEVFEVSDISLAKEAAGVLSDFKVEISPIIFWTALCIVAAQVLYWFADHILKNRLPVWVRCVGIVVGIVFCMNLFPVGKAIYTLAQMPDIFFETEDFYEENGLMAGIFRTLPEKPQKPDGYSEKLVASVCDNYQGKENSETKPNILFIMNESLYDISALSGVEFDKEPLAYLKEYQKKYSSGTLFSPSYAGSTAQVEFEVITGYATSGLSGMAYTDYVTKPMDTMVSVMNNAGYDTYAIHPYRPTFYRRETVYKMFDFKHRYFQEDMENLSTLGSWTDDASLYQNVEKIYEQREKDKPFFAYIVTTQNHGGHQWEFPLDKKEISVTKKGMEPSAKEALCTYGNLIHKSDEALHSLLTYFEKQETPTIIVVFGDHSPELAQFGITPDFSTPQAYHMLHSTPLLIWNNYGLPKKDVGSISAYRLGAYVSALAGVTEDSYMSMLASEDFPNYEGNTLVTTDGNAVALSTVGEEVWDKFSDMWTIQYDRMFGSDYYRNITQKDKK